MHKALSRIDKLWLRKNIVGEILIREFHTNEHRKQIYSFNKCSYLKVASLVFPKERRNNYDNGTAIRSFPIKRIPKLQ
jgi:hypothetical protein